MVEQTCPINAVKDSTGSWSYDVYCHKIVCINCGEWFQAHVDFYHGGGSFKKEDERLKNAKSGSLFDL
jgi:hypothetical protein